MSEQVNVIQSERGHVGEAIAKVVAECANLNLDALTAKKESLWLETQKLQDALADRNRVTADGQRLDGEEYWTWRKKAATALRYRVVEYREVKKILIARREEAYQMAHARRPVGDSWLVEGLFNLAERLIMESGKHDLSPDERHLMRQAWQILAQEDGDNE